MIRLLSLLCFVISALVFSQNTRFVYQVSMKTDSASQPVVENAYLDVSGTKSHFYGEKRIQRDSIMQRVFQTRNFSFDRSQMEQFRTQINYEIEKNLAEQTVSFKNRIGRDHYAYKEDRNFNWKILPETSNVGNYKVQRADVDFGGRKWTAWFTQDIPIADGPYKFCGLPGLIVKIEDSNGDYSFDLKETRKIAALPNIEQRGGNLIEVKREGYEKQMERYRKDPSSFMQSMRRGNSRGGNPQADMERKKRLEEEQKKHNNPIEL